MIPILLTFRDAKEIALEVDRLLGEPLAWVEPDDPRSRSAEVWFCAGSPPSAPIDLHRLRWIHSGWAGVDAWFTRPEWRVGVQLTRTIGDFPVRIAEYVFGYLLARELGAADALRQMKEKTWNRWTPGTLAGRELLIVGYGAVGRQIGAVARSLGMRVEGIRRGSGGPVEEGIHGPEALDRLLAKAEFVVNVLPHTAATESFWNRDRFGRMREGATFVNVSRGATVDEAAILDGIGRRRPARAILDVFREEPLPPSHPLRGVEGIWVTPHVAGIGTARALAVEFAKNWRRYRAGLPLQNVVDREIGY